MKRLVVSYFPVYLILFFMSLWACAIPDNSLNATPQVAFSGNLTTKIYGLHAVTQGVYATDPASVSALQLKNFIVRAKKKGFKFVSLQEGVEFPSSAKIVLCFDDGYLNNFTVAAPVLQAESVPATFFIHPSSIGQTFGAYPKMSWAHAAALDANPLFSVESHALMHRDMRQLSEQNLQDDAQNVRNMFMAHLGRSPRFLAYPMGQNNSLVRGVSAKYYEAAFSYGTNSSFSSSDKYRLPRLPANQKNIDLLFR